MEALPRRRTAVLATRHQPLPRHTVAQHCVGLQATRLPGLRQPGLRHGRNAVRRGTSGGGTGRRRCSMVSEGSALKPLGHLQKVF